MARRNMSQGQRLMIIILLGLIVLVVSGIIIMFNFDTSKIEERFNGQLENIISDTDDEGVATNDSEFNDISNDDLDGNYYPVAFDIDGCFVVSYEDEKLVLKVSDDELLLKEYPTAKISSSASREIISHNFKIREIYVEKLYDTKYLIVIDSDGKISFMDLDDAIADNVFRLRSELVSLDSKAVGVYGTIKKEEENVHNTAIIVTKAGFSYDLEDIIE